jgi:hypothetical protein
MGEACRDEKLAQDFDPKNFKGRHLSEDLDIDGKIILKIN